MLKEKFSAGLICIRINEKSKEHEFLMIRKRVTDSYVAWLMKEKSNMTIGHIQKLFNRMTISEKILVLDFGNFDKMWYHIWLSIPKHKYTHRSQIPSYIYKLLYMEEPHKNNIKSVRHKSLSDVKHECDTSNMSNETKSLLKSITPSEEYYNRYIKGSQTSQSFTHSLPKYSEYIRLKKDYMKYIDNDNNRHILQYLLLYGSDSLTDNTWEFPKGRIKNESYLNCAIREFKEETDISEKLIDTIHTKATIDVCIIDDNVKYKSKYYIATLHNPHGIKIRSSLSNLDQVKEIDAVEWKSISQLRNESIASKYVLACAKRAILLYKSMYKKQ